MDYWSETHPKYSNQSAGNVAGIQFLTRKLSIVNWDGLKELVLIQCVCIYIVWPINKTLQALKAELMNTSGLLINIKSKPFLCFLTIAGIRLDLLESNLIQNPETVDSGWVRSRGSKL